jgi:diguanylate cyclase (GGDEF)-like protein
MLTGCLKSLGKQLSSVDRAEIEDSYNRHLKTKPEYEAAVSALTDYHKSLFDQTNEFRAQVGLKPAEYSPVKLPKALAPEKGFEITGQSEPTPTTGAGKLKYQRDEARREADTDALTGIANRRALDRALPTAESDPNTSIISFDANNFGQVNKQLGEKAGDKALTEIADAFKQAAEENNTGARVFRRGGDEFVMIAPKDKAEAIRDRAEQLYGERKYGDTNVSVSGTVGNTFDEANATLQAAKAERKGRATIPANASQNNVGVESGNNTGEPAVTEQGASGASEKEVDTALLKQSFPIPDRPNDSPTSTTEADPPSNSHETESE